MLAEYPTTLILRLRMPLSDDLDPRNFLTKLTKFDKVVNIPNSMTVLHDMLPLALLMSQSGNVGVFNFCNPGVVSHNELLDLYKEYIDPMFTFQNFTLAEQDKLLACARSNNALDSTKLVANLPPGAHLPHIKEAVHSMFQRMQQNILRGQDSSAFTIL